jgi:hypothetical protein
MRRRIQLIAAAAIACLTVAGCGSSDNGTTTTQLTAQQYTQFLQRLSQRENQAHNALERAFHAKTVAQIQQTVLAFATDQSGAADQVSNVTPPANAKAANEMLEKAFKDTAASIHAVLPQIANASSPQAAMSAIQKAKGPQQAGQELDAALAQLKKLGYTKGS